MNKTKIAKINDSVIDVQKKQSEIEFLLNAPNEHQLKEKTKRSEILELQGGQKLNLREVKDFVKKANGAYDPMFEKEFYTEIYRLNNWKKDDFNFHHRPPIVGRWTREFIYGRFPKQIIEKLEEHNPYKEYGIRCFKHFQFLTHEAKQLLLGYIDDSVKIMKLCQTWQQFENLHREKYGKAFQLSLF